MKALDPEFTAWPWKETRDNMLDDQEIQALLRTVSEHTGVDFSQYAVSWIRRKIALQMQKEQVSTVAALREKMVHDPACLRKFFQTMALTVTSLFRNPSALRTLREQVVPCLRNSSFIRIWNAGCATGEEVYSLVIMLMEEGLYDRCRIYATDINEQALETAKAGIYPLRNMQEYTRNYLRAGGKQSLSEYYTAKYDRIIFRSSLRDHVIFARHNLIADQAFHQFNGILCRNVLFYFNESLQRKVRKLFSQSLLSPGFLMLGDEESLPDDEGHYDIVNSQAKIYKKSGK